MVSASVVAVHGHVVDGRNHVACSNTRLGRGRAIQRRDDDDLAVLHRYLDADAGVLARARDLDIVVLVAVEIGRIGIQRGHHAPHGGLQQAMIVDGLDVLALDLTHHLGEQLGILPGDVLPQHCGLVRKHSARERQRHADRYTRRHERSIAPFRAHRRQHTCGGVWPPVSCFRLKSGPRFTGWTSARPWDRRACAPHGSRSRAAAPCRRHR